jgi:Ca2+-dependent lipid-binding protein
VRERGPGVDIGKGLVLVAKGVFLQLPVADVVARLDDNPSLQVDLENIPVVRIFIKQILVVGLL